MLYLGLKLWSNNEKWFREAAQLYRQGEIHFIELYYSAFYTPNYKKLEMIKEVPVAIHNTDYFGFENFVIEERERIIWRETLFLANFFVSSRIIVHPGRDHTHSSFLRNLKKIDDPRILIENMPGVDCLGQPMYAYNLEQLTHIRKTKDICFDFEKAVKAACRDKLQYKSFITRCVRELRPRYFHISGCDARTPLDEHLDLWDSTFDILWTKELLGKLCRKNDIYLVFETPKRGKGLENDRKNIEYFKKL